MAAPRLPFLWPTLFRQPKSPRPRATISKATALNSAHRPRQTCRGFATSPRCKDEINTQRYGKAHEPAPHLKEQEAAREAADEAARESAKEIAEAAAAVVAKEVSQKKKTASQPKTTPEKSAPSPTEQKKDDEAPEKETSEPSTNPVTNFSTPKPEAANDIPEPPHTPLEPPSQGALDSVLHMPGPQEAEAHKPPHLKTPPYVHHFDTYGLVRELTRNSAYTSAQSILIMKGVRQMLLDNMELARDGLVSKSNVENSTYLFRAACSELKNEVGNMRKMDVERMRTERNQLQHEVDILGQRLGQEMSGLRDELKGLFDDRKMAVRQEQRSMTTAIQELGYKITIALNSESRSEVEGLRWVLTRRAAITLGISAFMLFVGLRYVSYYQHLEEKKKEKEKGGGGGSGGGGNGNGNGSGNGGSGSGSGGGQGQGQGSGGGAGGGGGGGGDEVLASEGVGLA